MIQDTGNNQTGLNADTSQLGLNASIIVPPGGVLPRIGLPVARNLTALASGYMAAYASVPGFGGYASGDQFVPLTNASAGWAGGVVAGPAKATRWFSENYGTALAAPHLIECVIARTGLVPTLVSALNGGTAITIGATVGKSALTGASLSPYLTAVAAAVGTTYGVVAAFPILTTLNAAVNAGPAQVAGIYNSSGISTTTGLTINPGQANQETVYPTAVTPAAPAVSSLTIAGTAGSAAVVQLTFNLQGYQGSTGAAPSGTATTVFTLSIPIPSGSTATVAANIIAAALAQTGFTFGAPQNILNIGAGTFNQLNGAPASGPLVLVTNSGAGVLTFSAASPGIWANSLLTYTVTVLNGTTQTYNTAVGGSATPVAFTNGAAGVFTATFQNAHVAGEPVIGFNTTLGASVVPVPGTTGQQNVGLALVDLFTA